MPIVEIEASRYQKLKVVNKQTQPGGLLINIIPIGKLSWQVFFSIS